MSISKPFHIVSMFIHSPALYRLLDLNECTGLPSLLLSLKFRLPFFQCVKNLARQGFPSSTCPIGHCCVCSPLLFGSEIHLYFVICQHTVNRGWIKWAQVGGPVAWKPKMHDDIMLNGVFSIILWYVARQLDTKTDEKIYDQSEIALCLWSSRDLRTRQNQKLHKNNNNGNFICVFECSFVNLAAYRQFTNAAWD